MSSRIVPSIRYGGDGSDQSDLFFFVWMCVLFFVIMEIGPGGYTHLLRPYCLHPAWLELQIFFGLFFSTYIFSIVIIYNFYTYFCKRERERGRDELEGFIENLGRILKG